MLNQCLFFEETIFHYLIEFPLRSHFSRVLCFRSFEKNFHIWDEFEFVCPIYQQLLHIFNVLVEIQCSSFLVVIFLYVSRSHKEKRSSYAPETGVRYDGIYRIEKCWRKVGIQVCLATAGDSMCSTYKLILFFW